MSTSVNQEDIRVMNKKSYTGGNFFAEFVLLLHLLTTLPTSYNLGKTRMKSMGKSNSARYRPSNEDFTYLVVFFMDGNK